MEDDYDFYNTFAPHNVAQPVQDDLLEPSSADSNAGLLQQLRPVTPDVQPAASIESNLNNCQYHISNSDEELDIREPTLSLVLSLSVGGFGTILHGVAQFITFRKKSRQFIDRGVVDDGILSNDKRCFRLTRLHCREFYYALSLLRQHFPRQWSGGHSDQVILLTGLCHLSGGHRLLDTAEILKIGNATAFKHTRAVVSAILKASRENTPFKVAFPGNMQETAARFRQVILGAGAVLAPDVAGAIDCTHTKIKAPSISHCETYYTITKRAYTISSQGICGRDKIFYDMQVGFPGRINDARILTETNVLNKVPATYRLLGDGAYICSDKIISPYRDTGNLTEDHKKWNTVISKARICVELAFGAAKNRWRFLYENEITDLRYLNRAVYACFCLHNFCVHMKLPEPDENGDPIPTGAELPPAPDIDSENPFEEEFITSTVWRDYYRTMMM